jgi:NDP-sugar pyrophosphorylase family protein
MRGMILAGGMSTRLQPLTSDIPKPLVPVLDRPVIGHVIDYLRQYGVDDLVVNVHYHADAVENYIGDGSDFGVRMTYLREETLLGSAGAVKQVEDRFQSTFVVIGCDDVTDVDLEAALAFHRARRASPTFRKSPSKARSAAILRTPVFTSLKSRCSRESPQRPFTILETRFSRSCWRRRRDSSAFAKARIGATSGRPQNTAGRISMRSPVGCC